MTALALGGSPSPLWYTTRATGVLALLMLTATVVLGLLTAVRFDTCRWSRVLTSGLHRNVSLLVLVFLALHVLTAELDTFAPVGWLAVVVPFASSYRPVWLGLGTVASDLLIALVATSLLRTRLGYRTWRVVHWAAYACWPVALAHGLGTGTDTRLTWVLGLDAVCVAVVLVALWWRLAAGWPAHRRLRVTAAAASVALPALGVAWLVAGPLAPGWAARAGTPAALLGHAGTAGGQGSPAHPTAAAAGDRLPALPLTATVTGSVAESRPGAGGQVTVSVHATAAGSPATVLGVDIRGTPDAAAGVTMTSSEVTWGPVGDPHRYRGSVTALNGNQIQAALADTGGAALNLTVSLRFAGHDAHGTLHVTRVRAGGR